MGDTCESGYDPTYPDWLKQVDERIFCVLPGETHRSMPLASLWNHWFVQGLDPGSAVIRYVNSGVFPTFTRAFERREGASNDHAGPHVGTDT